MPSRPATARRLPSPASSAAASRASVGVNSNSRHQCRIARSGAGLTLEKLTGDGFNATISPCKDAARVVVGRTFLRDQKERGYDAAQPANRGNDNFGNKVGMAYADGGRLLVLSINERGFTEPDDTFFEVLLLEP